MVYIDDLYISYLDENTIKFTLYRYFYTVASKYDVESAGGEFLIENGKLRYTKFDEERSDIRLWRLITKLIKNLKMSISTNDAIFVDKDSNIPLFGLQYLGIVDKGSEMIEIKQITNCNMNCIFCSVNEGPDSNKQVDFVVENEYLIDELFKLLEIKETQNNNIWINPHGEPLLYDKQVEFIKAISTHPKIKDIIIITNGMMLNEKIIQDLKDAGLTKLSISISAASEKTAKKIMGHDGYSLERVLKNARKAKEIGLHVEVNPVYVKGYNDHEMQQLINTIADIDERIGIQKFCHNKLGRNPIKEQSWESFFEELKQLEKTNVKLIHELGKLEETKTLPMPFKKGDTIEVEIIAHSRYKRDKIGILQNRAIQIIGCLKEKGKQKVKIVSAKHNLFVATPFGK